MRLWVTRTQPQAAATAERLERLGHQPVIQPVLEVRPLAGASIDLAGAGAIAFSSQNGVEAFASLCSRRDLPAFVTGEGTARSALAIGFGKVEAAGGGLEQLAELIKARHRQGQVAWFGPAEPAGDLAAMLAPAGVVARLHPIYQTVPVTAPAPEGIDGILIHSPKAASVVAHMVSEQAARSLALFAISQAAARPLSGLRFASVNVAATPNEEALLALVQAAGR